MPNGFHGGGGGALKGPVPGKKRVTKRAGGKKAGATKAGAKKAAKKGAKKR